MNKHKFPFILFVLTLFTSLNTGLTQQEALTTISIPAQDNNQVTLNFECVKGVLSSAIRGLDYVSSENFADTYLGILGGGVKPINITSPSKPNEIQVSKNKADMSLWVNTLSEPARTFSSGVPVVTVQTSVEYIGRTYDFDNSQLRQSLERLSCTP